MAGRVAGRVALVTGAARGQGRAHAVRLAEEGADVAVLDAVAGSATVSYPMPDAGDLEETVARVEAAGGRAVPIVADVRDGAQMAAAAAAMLESFGRIDVVVANAGICPPGLPGQDIPEEHWRDVLDVNLTGAWQTVRACIPAMLARDAGGSIVFAASSAGLTCTPHMAHYNASKAGVIALAKTLANELAAARIRVNAICPSAVGTPMIMNEASWALFRPDLENPTMEDALPAFRALHPMGEPWLEPLDVSNAVLWLASDEARYVTGIALPVDLGWNNKSF